MSRLFTLPATIMVGLALGLAARWVVTSPTEGNHYWIPHNHLGSINHFAVDNACVYMTNSDMSFDDAFLRIQQTLYHPSGWDLLGGGRLFFTVSSQSCDEMSDPERANIEVEYEVKDDTSGLPCEGYSCAYSLPGHIYFDSTSGHDEYRYYFVTLKTEHIDDDISLARHTINHETGHVLGLKDGDGTCPGSIMHSKVYFCNENLEWPATIDLNSVEEVISTAGSPLSFGSWDKGFGVP